jgi:hypothetical protein
MHGVPLAPLGQLLRGLLDDPRISGLIERASGQPSPGQSSASVPGGLLAGLLPDADTRRAPE